MNYGLSGRYKVMVLDARTKRVKRQDRHWHSNLIMNNGMNKIASTLLCNCFTYAIAGTGTTTGDRVSSLLGTTATGDVAGNVTLSGGTLTFNLVAPSWDMGNIIKWNNTGFEGRITTLTDGTHAVISPLPSAPQSGNFVIYRTNFNTLVTEVVRTNTYVAASPYCGTTLIGNTLVHQRSWDFPAEVTTKNYTEMGVGWSGTLNDTGDSLGGTVFARFLLHGVTTVNAGEQLRLVYQLRVVLDPYTDTAKTAAITGWPVAPSTLLTGVEKMQLLGLSSISAVGATTNYDTGYYVNEPSHLANANAWLSTDATANTAFGSCVNRVAGQVGYGAVTSPSYTLHSYSVIKEITFGAGSGNSTSIRSMGMGYNGGGNQPARYNTVSFVFTEPQTKTVAYTLSMQWYNTWRRVLSASSV